MACPTVELPTPYSSAKLRLLGSFARIRPDRRPDCVRGDPRRRRDRVPGCGHHLLLGADRVAAQLFLVIAGSGWVAGADGIRHPIQAGQGAHWAAGEVHTSGTDTSLTAPRGGGIGLRLFEPKHS
jgi:hypothetical protein